MFVFACPIIAKSQRWLFALKYPYLPRIQVQVSAQWFQRLYVKVQGKIVHKDMHQIEFQSN